MRLQEIFVRSSDTAKIAIADLGWITLNVVCLCEMRSFTGTLCPFEGAISLEGLDSWMQNIRAIPQFFLIEA